LEDERSLKISVAVITKAFPDAEVSRFGSFAGRAAKGAVIRYDASTTRILCFTEKNVSVVISLFVLDDEAEDVQSGMELIVRSFVIKDTAATKE
jgi:hypothetical protein